MLFRRVLLFCLIVASVEARANEATTPTVAGGEPLAHSLDSMAAVAASESFALLRELLRIPNDANIPEQIEPNIRWCETAFAQRGFSTTRLDTQSQPLLLAQRVVNPDRPTVLVYLQIDGQPVDPAAWQQEDPFEPVLKARNDSGEWRALPWDEINDYDDDMRVFARSASDAKGPVAMFLAAWDVMQAHERLPDFNLKIIMDFEEELGSPQLPNAVIEYRDALSADRFVIFDGPRHGSNKPTLSFGARGIATLTLTTYGPVVPQHSGHYGNYAPNPALRMAQLLASFKDDEGRVTIDGFYDGVVIDEDAQARLRAVPDDEDAIRERLQLGSVDKVGRYYQESIQYPSLNIRGLQSGWIDNEVRTIVPAWARAEIDIRLVKETEPERLIALLREHIQKQGYHLITGVPDKAMRLAHPKIATFNYTVSYQSFRTPMESPIGDWLRLALQRAFGEEPVQIRMSGGSIPISPFVNTLGVPAVAVPTVNRDNNQHSPNENLRLGNYRDGIKTILAILLQPY